MPVAERPPKKPPKTTTKGRVGSSQLRAAVYGDDPHGDQAREAEAAMTKLRGGDGGMTAREALSKLMAAEPAPAAADALVRRTLLLGTSRSVLDTMLLEEDFVEEVGSTGHLQRPGSELEHWVHGRIVASIAACRSREKALQRELGHGVDLHMLKAPSPIPNANANPNPNPNANANPNPNPDPSTDPDPNPNPNQADADADAALKRMSELRQLRDLAREDGAAADDLWSEYLLNEEAASPTGGGFRYSRELLRARQMLSKPGGAERAAKLLRAVWPSRPQP